MDPADEAFKRAYRTAERMAGRAAERRADPTIREAADALAANVNSFLDSLPYMAPEALELQTRVKLAEPLAAYREATRET